MTELRYPTMKTFRKLKKAGLINEPPEDFRPPEIINGRRVRWGSPRYPQVEPVNEDVLSFEFEGRKFRLEYRGLVVYPVLLLDDDLPRVPISLKQRERLLITQIRWGLKNGSNI